MLQPSETTIIAMNVSLIYEKYKFFNSATFTATETSVIALIVSLIYEKYNF